MQTQNINALPGNKLNEEDKAHWLVQFDFNRSPNETSRSLFYNFRLEYYSIINYLTTQRNGSYLAVPDFEELLTADPPDDDILALQGAWQSCCSQFWEIQWKYDQSSTKPRFILHETIKRLRNLPIDITMASTADVSWSPTNRVTKAKWMQRITLPLSSNRRLEWKS